MHRKWELGRSQRKFFKNNLNQISKKLNQGLEFDINLNEFKGDLTKAIDELKEMAKKN